MRILSKTSFEKGKRCHIWLKVSFAFPVNLYKTLKDYIEISCVECFPYSELILNRFVCQLT